jgi:putative transposase
MCIRVAAWAAECRVRCADLTFDALEQVLYERAGDLDSLVHHSERGTQYLSIRYTETGRGRRGSLGGQPR